MNRLLLTPLFVLLFAAVAAGHSLWVTVQPSSGPDTVRVVFEHSTAPGKGDYNQQILTRGKTWVRRSGDMQTEPVELEETGAPGALYLRGETTSHAPRAIEHACLFGLYRGRLDRFYGKYLDVASAAELDALARTPSQPIDIVASVAGDALRLTVLWNGRPLTDHAIGVISPDGAESKLRTDTQGNLSYRPPSTGVYGFYSVRLDHDAKGEFEGESYQGTMHATTLTLHWPLGQAKP